MKGVSGSRKKKKEDMFICKTIYMIYQETPGAEWIGVVVQVGCWLVKCLYVSTVDDRGPDGLTSI